MDVLTPTLTLGAPASTVFDFLCDLTRLAEWSSAYWAPAAGDASVGDRSRRSGLLSAGHRITVRHRREAGVLDLQVRSAAGSVSLLPMRVLDLPEGGSLLTVTYLPANDWPQERVDQEYRNLCEALGHLAERFDGELHAPVRNPFAPPRSS